MYGRRKDARYRLSVREEGVLRVMRDVVVQRVDGRDVYALGDALEAAGLELTVETGEDRQRSMRVRLKQCTPILVGGNVRYRLHFAVID